MKKLTSIERAVKYIIESVYRLANDFKEESLVSSILSDLDSILAADYDDFCVHRSFDKPHYGKPSPMVNIRGREEEFCRRFINTIKQDDDFRKTLKIIFRSSKKTAKFKRNVTDFCRIDPRDTYSCEDTWQRVYNTIRPYVFLPGEEDTIDLDD